MFLKTIEQPADGPRKTWSATETLSSAGRAAVQSLWGEITPLGQRIKDISPQIDEVLTDRDPDASAARLEPLYAELEGAIADLHRAWDRLRVMRFEQSRTPLFAEGTKEHAAAMRLSRALRVTRNWLWEGRRTAVPMVTDVFDALDEAGAALPEGEEIRKNLLEKAGLALPEGEIKVRGLVEFTKVQEVLMGAWAKRLAPALKNFILNSIYLLYESQAKEAATLQTGEPARFADPHVWLELSDEPRSGRQGIRIVIRDNGPGFDPAIIGPDGVVNLDLIRSLRVGGTGLGIGEARRYIEDVGGTIEIRQQRDPRFTEVSIWLPATGLWQLPPAADSLIRLSELSPDEALAFLKDYLFKSVPPHIPFLASDIAVHVRAEEGEVLRHFSRLQEEGYLLPQDVELPDGTTTTAYERAEQPEDALSVKSQPGPGTLRVDGSGPFVWDEDGVKRELRITSQHTAPGRLNLILRTIEDAGGSVEPGMRGDDQSEDIYITVRALSFEALDRVRAALLTIPDETTATLRMVVNDPHTVTGVTGVLANDVPDEQKYQAKYQIGVTQFRTTALEGEQQELVFELSIPPKLGPAKIVDMISAVPGVQSDSVTLNYHNARPAIPTYRRVAPVGGGIHRGPSAPRGQFAVLPVAAGLGLPEMLSQWMPGWLPMMAIGLLAALLIALPMLGMVRGRQPKTPQERLDEVIARERALSEFVRTSHGALSDGHRNVLIGNRPQDIDYRQLRDREQSLASAREELARLAIERRQLEQELGIAQPPAPSRRRRTHRSELPGLLLIISGMSLAAMFGSPELGILPMLIGSVSRKTSGRRASASTGVASRAAVAERTTSQRGAAFRRTTPLMHLDEVVDAHLARLQQRAHDPLVQELRRIAQQRWTMDEAIDAMRERIAVQSAAEPDGLTLEQALTDARKRSDVVGNQTNPIIPALQFLAEEELFPALAERLPVLLREYFAFRFLRERGWLLRGAAQQSRSRGRELLTVLVIGSAALLGLAVTGNPLSWLAAGLLPLVVGSLANPSRPALNGRRTPQEFYEAAETWAASGAHDWAGQFYAELMRVVEEHPERMDAARAALRQLLFHETSANRDAASWIISRPEFSGSVEHSKVASWHHRSVADVLKGYGPAHEAVGIVVEAYWSSASAQTRESLLDQLMSLVMFNDPGSELHRRARWTLQDLFGFDLLPLNRVRVDGWLYDALEQGRFKPGDEGKVTFTHVDPMTVRLRMRQARGLLPDVTVRVTTQGRELYTLRLTDASVDERDGITEYVWQLGEPTWASGSMELELVMSDSSGAQEIVLERREFMEIEKLLPEQIPMDPVAYTPLPELRDKQVAVLAMEASLMPEGLHGAMGGGLGILLGGFLRSLRYSGADVWMPLPRYRTGVRQEVRDGYTRIIRDAPLDYAELLRAATPGEHWEEVERKTVRFTLSGYPQSAEVTLMRLRIDGTARTINVPLIELSGDISGNLYPGNPDDLRRFKQAAFYGRAALEAFKAFNVTPDILQVHESFPAVSIVLDLFENPEYRDDPHFASAKRHVVGFAHTVVPQAFPHYEPSFLKELGFSPEQYQPYLVKRQMIDGGERMRFDPFHTLSQKAAVIGTVGLEHRRVMRATFPDFAGKYVAIEDSVWPLEWMLPEQQAQGGRILELGQIWEAKARAEERMIEELTRLTGRRLRAGRPTIVEARRFTDYKWNTFFLGLPGRIGLQGLYYLTADPEEGGLGLNVIVGGKAHEEDGLGQRWVRELQQAQDDPRLHGAYLFVPWTPDIAKVVIQGAKASLQTSIPPLEAAGMKDKKDMITYSVVVSSYTGGPVQQVTNVLTHGARGNGYLFEPFSHQALQAALEDLSARFYAYIYAREGRDPESLRRFPNTIWANRVIRYMTEQAPNDILRVMQNAGRMLPVVDARTAALKFGSVYGRILGIPINYSIYPAIIQKLLRDFEAQLGLPSDDGTPPPAPRGPPQETGPPAAPTSDQSPSVSAQPRGTPQGEAVFNGPGKVALPRGMSAFVPVVFAVESIDAASAGLVLIIVGVLLDVLAGVMASHLRSGALDLSRREIRLVGQDEGWMRSLENLAHRAMNAALAIAVGAVAFVGLGLIIGGVLMMVFGVPGASGMDMSLSAAALPMVLGTIHWSAAAPGNGPQGGNGGMDARERLRESLLATIAVIVSLLGAAAFGAPEWGVGLALPVMLTTVRTRQEQGERNVTPLPMWRRLPGTIAIATLAALLMMPGSLGDRDAELGSQAPAIAAQEPDVVIPSALSQLAGRSLPAETEHALRQTVLEFGWEALPSLITIRQDWHRPHGERRTADELIIELVQDRDAALDVLRRARATGDVPLQRQLEEALWLAYRWGGRLDLEVELGRPIWRPAQIAGAIAAIWWWVWATHLLPILRWRRPHPVSVDVRFVTWVETMEERDWWPLWWWLLPSGFAIASLPWLPRLLFTPSLGIVLGWLVASSVAAAVISGVSSGIIESAGDALDRWTGNRYERSTIGSPHRARRLLWYRTLLSSPKAWLRRRAVEMLADDGDRDVTGQLLALIHDPDATVRAAVIIAMERLQAAEAVPALRAALHDLDPVMRDHAVRALGGLGAINAIPDLVQLFHQDRHLPTAAVALNRLGWRPEGAGDWERFHVGLQQAMGIVSPDPIEVIDNRLQQISPEITEEVDAGHPGQTYVSTSPNPEYVALMQRRQQLTKQGGRTWAEPSAGVPLNRSLLQAAQAGQIDVERIPDERLRAFLQWLRQHKLDDIVVFGGAVRDLLLGTSPDDLDVTISVELTPEEAAAMSTTTSQANPRVLGEALDAVERLAAALGGAPEQLLNPQPGRELTFMGLPVQYAGPVRRVTSAGTPVIVKRAFVDARSRRLVRSSTGANILGFGLYSDGRVVADPQALEDLSLGRLRIVGDGENFFLGDVLRILRLKHQFGLAVSQEDAQTVRARLDAYRQERLVLAPSELPAVEQVAAKVIRTARDPEAVRAELESLGVPQLLERARAPGAPAVYAVLPGLGLFAGWPELAEWLSAHSALLGIAVALSLGLATVRWFTHKRTSRARSSAESDAKDDAVFIGVRLIARWIVLLATGLLAALLFGGVARGAEPRAPAPPAADVAETAMTAQIGIFLESVRSQEEDLLVINHMVAMLKALDGGARDLIDRPDDPDFPPAVIVVDDLGEFVRAFGRPEITRSYEAQLADNKMLSDLGVIIGSPGRAAYTIIMTQDVVEQSARLLGTLALHLAGSFPLERDFSSHGWSIARKQTTAYQRSVKILTALLDDPAFAALRSEISDGGLVALRNEVVPEFRGKVESWKVRLTPEERAAMAMPTPAPSATPSPDTSSDGTPTPSASPREPGASDALAALLAIIASHGSRADRRRQEKTARKAAANGTQAPTLTRRRLLWMGGAAAVLAAAEAARRSITPTLIPAMTPQQPRPVPIPTMTPSQERSDFEPEEADRSPQVAAWKQEILDAMDAAIAQMPEDATEDRPRAQAIRDSIAGPLGVLYNTPNQPLHARTAIEIIYSAEDPTQVEAIAVNYGVFPALGWPYQTAAMTHEGAHLLQQTTLRLAENEWVDTLDLALRVFPARPGESPEEHLERFFANPQHAEFVKEGMVFFLELEAQAREVELSYLRRLANHIGREAIIIAAQPEMRPMVAEVVHGASSMTRPDGSMSDRQRLVLRQHFVGRLAEFGVDYLTRSLMRAVLAQGDLSWLLNAEYQHRVPPLAPLPSSSGDRLSRAVSALPLLAGATETPKQQAVKQLRGITERLTAIRARMGATTLAHADVTYGFALGQVRAALDILQTIQDVATLGARAIIIREGLRSVITYVDDARSSLYRDAERLDWLGENDRRELRNMAAELEEIRNDLERILADLDRQPPASSVYEPGLRPAGLSEEVPVAAPRSLEELLREFLRGTEFEGRRRSRRPRGEASQVTQVTPTDWAALSDEDVLRAVIRQLDAALPPRRDHRWTRNFQEENAVNDLRRAITRLIGLRTVERAWPRLIENIRDEMRPSVSMVEYLLAERRSPNHPDTVKLRVASERLANVMQGLHVLRDRLVEQVRAKREVSARESPASGEGWTIQREPARPRLARPTAPAPRAAPAAAGPTREDRARDVDTFERDLNAFLRATPTREGHEALARRLTRIRAQATVAHDTDVLNSTRGWAHSLEQVDETLSKAERAARAPVPASAARPEPAAAPEPSPQAESEAVAPQESRADAVRRLEAALSELLVPLAGPKAWQRRGYLLPGNPQGGLIAIQSARTALRRGTDQDVLSALRLLNEGVSALTPLADKHPELKPLFIEGFGIYQELLELSERFDIKPQAQPTPTRRGLFAVAPLALAGESLWTLLRHRLFTDDTQLPLIGLAIAAGALIALGLELRRSLPAMLRADRISRTVEIGTTRGEFKEQVAVDRFIYRIASRAMVALGLLIYTGIIVWAGWHAWDIWSSMPLAAPLVIGMTRHKQVYEIVRAAGAEGIQFNAVVSEISRNMSFRYQDVTINDYLRKLQIMGLIAPSISHSGERYAITPEAARADQRALGQHLAELRTPLTPERLERVRAAIRAELVRAAQEAGTFREERRYLGGTRRQAMSVDVFLRNPAQLGFVLNIAPRGARSEPLSKDVIASIVNSDGTVTNLRNRGILWSGEVIRLEPQEALAPSTSTAPTSRAVIRQLQRAIRQRWSEATSEQQEAYWLNPDRLVATAIATLRLQTVVMTQPLRETIERTLRATVGETDPIERRIEAAAVRLWEQASEERRQALRSDPRLYETLTLGAIATRSITLTREIQEAVRDSAWAVLQADQALTTFFDDLEARNQLRPFVRRMVETWRALVLKSPGTIGLFLLGVLGAAMLFGEWTSGMTFAPMALMVRSSAPDRRFQDGRGADKVVETHPVPWAMDGKFLGEFLRREFSERYTWVSENADVEDEARLAVPVDGVVAIIRREGEEAVFNASPGDVVRAGDQVSLVHVSLWQRLHDYKKAKLRHSFMDFELAFQDRSDIEISYETRVIRGRGYPEALGVIAPVIATPSDIIQAIVASGLIRWNRSERRMLGEARQDFRDIANGYNVSVTASHPNPDDTLFEQTIGGLRQQHPELAEELARPDVLVILEHFFYSPRLSPEEMRQRIQQLFMEEYLEDLYSRQDRLIDHTKRLTLTDEQADDIAAALIAARQARAAGASTVLMSLAVIALAAGALTAALFGGWVSGGMLAAPLVIGMARPVTRSPDAVFLALTQSLRPMTAKELAEGLGIKPSAVNGDLLVLRRLGLVMYGGIREGDPARDKSDPTYVITPEAAEADHERLADILWTVGGGAAGVLVERARPEIQQEVLANVPTGYQEERLYVSPRLLNMSITRLLGDPGLLGVSVHVRVVVGHAVMAPGTIIKIRRTATGEIEDVVEGSVIRPGDRVIFESGRPPRAGEFVVPERRRLPEPVAVRRSPTIVDDSLRLHAGGVPEHIARAMVRRWAGLSLARRREYRTNPDGLYLGVLEELGERDILRSPELRRGLRHATVGILAFSIGHPEETWSDETVERAVAFLVHGADQEPVRSTGVRGLAAALAAVAAGVGLSLWGSDASSEGVLQAGVVFMGLLAGAVWFDILGRVMRADERFLRGSAWRRGRLDRLVRRARGRDDLIAGFHPDPSSKVLTHYNPVTGRIMASGGAGSLAVRGLPGTYHPFVQYNLLVHEAAHAVLGVSSAPAVHWIAYAVQAAPLWFALAGVVFGGWIGLAVGVLAGMVLQAG
ncbi:MAG: hypothetical protein COV75_03755, partial [Candidatus Omnitrophica bacterium CG11_big_fil_rev_8_21_14_0_20_63_9]